MFRKTKKKKITFLSDFVPEQWSFDHLKSIDTVVTIDHHSCHSATGNGSKRVAKRNSEIQHLLLLLFHHNRVPDDHQ